ncbi:MAG: hypothetical protein P4L74_01995 [Candidatus Doudnabacteria bacterium]|nr:hypothetical protein [Candidatus Doudnabacteria bacterium]
MNVKQKKILSLLIKNDGQKFSQLQKNFKEADKFAYHLDYLKKQSFISKKVDKYYISNKGARQFRYFDAQTLLSVEEKLPTLVLVCRLGGKFLLRKSADGSFGLWPIRLLVGEPIDKIIEDRIKEYGFVGKPKYRCAQNMTIKEADELVYDIVWLVFDVKIQSYDFKNDNFEPFSLKEIKSFKNKDELTEEFIVKNNKRPFSAATKIL